MIRNTDRWRSLRINADQFRSIVMNKDLCRSLRIYAGSVSNLDLLLVFVQFYNAKMPQGYFMNFQVCQAFKTAQRKESRATLACLYRTSGRFFMLQLIIVDSSQFTLHRINEPHLCQYRLRMWGSSDTLSYRKGSWASIDWKCPTFFVIDLWIIRQNNVKAHLRHVL